MPKFTGNPEYAKRQWEIYKAIDKLAHDFPKEFEQDPIRYETDAQTEKRVTE